MAALIDKTQIIAQAVAMSEHFGLDHNLVLAIISVESNFDRYAIRYEPTWSYFYKPESFSRLVGISEQTEAMLQASSIGLMQVMGTVARELEFKENLLKLTQVEIGLYYGCKKLKSLADKYPSLDDVISAYNAGSPRIDSHTQLYRNQHYVNKVKGALNGQIRQP